MKFVFIHKSEKTKKIEMIKKIFKRIQKNYSTMNFKDSKMQRSYIPQGLGYVKNKLINKKGTLIMINAGLAENKNLNKWIWALISIPIGPIATGIIVFAYNNDTKEKN
jgi:hypothetical protein